MEQKDFKRTDLFLVAKRVEYLGHLSGSCGWISGDGSRKTEIEETKKWGIVRVSTVNFFPSFTLASFFFVCFFIPFLSVSYFSVCFPCLQFVPLLFLF